MIIQCENCKRKFKVDDNRIKPEGTRVRCSKCGHMFMLEISEGTSAGSEPGTKTEITAEAHESESPGNVELFSPGESTDGFRDKELFDNNDEAAADDIGRIRPEISEIEQTDNDIEISRHEEPVEDILDFTADDALNADLDVQTVPTDEVEAAAWEKTEESKYQSEFEAPAKSAAPEAGDTDSDAGAVTATGGEAGTVEDIQDEPGSESAEILPAGRTDQTEHEPRQEEPSLEPETSSEHDREDFNTAQGDAAGLESRQEPETDFQIEDTEGFEKSPEEPEYTVEESPSGYEPVTVADSGDPDAEHETDRTGIEQSNWEEFVEISRGEDETDVDELRAEETRDEKAAGFDWERLSVGGETERESTDAPDMYEDEGRSQIHVTAEPELEDAAPEYTDREEMPGTLKEEAAVTRERVRDEGRMTLDTEVLARTAPVETRTTHPRDEYTRIHKPQSGPLKKIFYAIFTVVVLTVITVSILIILVNKQIITDEEVAGLKRSVESVLPVKFGQSAKTDIVISRHGGKWMETVNGPMYVISGKILNRSEEPVNYVQIKAEFLSAGQMLYENVIYAGNTFTENELKAAPIEQTLLKLKKKSGDIDYYNTNKLAGLNFNIKPGEEIPFFAVFPARSKLLGLRYNLQVADYESASYN